MLCSPFLGAVRTISFASPTQYYIHRGVLSKYEKLNACYDPWKDSIHLADVPDHVGRTIIHYLYSGTLEQHDELDANLRAYCVAQEYSIHELAQFAKQRVDDTLQNSSTAGIMETIQGAAKLFTKDDGWLDDLVRVQSRRLLQEQLLRNQDFIQALLITNDRVSKILLQEMLTLCARPSAATPAGSDVSNGCLLDQDHVSIRTLDATEDTPVMEVPVPEPGGIQNESTSSNKPMEEVKNAGISFPLDADRHPERKQTKKERKKLLKARKEEQRRQEQERKEQEVDRLQQAGCLCEGHRIFGCSYGWTNCDECRTKVTNLAMRNT